MVPWKTILSVTLATLLPAQTSTAQGKADWPDFRGPSWDGHAPKNAKVPLRWSEKENVRWKTKIDGMGWSTPAVHGGRAFLTTATPKGHDMFVIGVDLETGNKVIERKLFHNDKPRRRNGLNSYASPSPVIEKGRVYVHFGTYGTACLDTKTGKTIWERRDINCNHMEGPGSSPVLCGKLLIVNMDGGDLQYVIALNKKTGKTKWRQKRSVDFGRLPPDFRKAYGTPILIKVNGKDQLISQGAQAAMAYDPKTGKEIWQCRYKGFSLSSRPLFGNGLLYLNTGYMRPQVIAVKPTGKGDITDDIVWTYKRSVPAMPSALLVDGLYYMVSDEGMLTCLDAVSGERLWRKRLNEKFCASPVYAAGRLYFFGRDGKATVLAPGKEFKELAVNRLDDGFMASPAVLPDGLLLRTTSHLYRVEAKGQKKVGPAGTTSKPTAPKKGEIR